MPWPTTCPACGEPPSGRGEHLVREHAFHRCSRCGTLFCVSGPNPVGPGSVNGDSSQRDEDGNRRRAAAAVLAHAECIGSKGRLLEVSAGPSHLVAEALRRGWDAAGVAVDPAAAVSSRAELDAGHLVPAELTDAGFAEGEFDAVALIGVLERLRDPMPLLREVARLTRQGGVISVLTPNAGGRVSRLTGVRRRWLQRAGSHPVLYTAPGVARLLERAGFQALGWHSVGAAQGSRAFSRIPRPGRRTELCLHGTRVESGSVRVGASLARLPRRAPAAQPHEAVFDDLRALSAASGLVDWMFDQYREAVGGRIAEIGAGIGTFSDKLLAGGAEELLLIEPDPACAAVLEARFADDPRVQVAREMLPEAPALATRPESFDLIVCQNVLEHIREDTATVAAIGAALRPGGQLTLLVPAHPRLYGSLDEAYGHCRRYTQASLRAVVEEASLEVRDLYSFNALGVPGWWAKNRSGGGGIGSGPLRAYEALLRVWRPLEERLRPPVGLSLIAHCTRPAGAVPTRRAVTLPRDPQNTRRNPH